MPAAAAKKKRHPSTARPSKAHLAPAAEGPRLRIRLFGPIGVEIGDA